VPEATRETPGDKQGQKMAKNPAPKDDAQDAAATAQTGPVLSVLAQYIKDLSFENPGAPNSLRQRESSPNINININVSANALSQSEFEVGLKLEAKATSGTDTIFNIELLYAGVFRIQGVPAETIQPALLIECPRLLFPFARQLVADATRNGGFPPLMIDPVDFARLYQQRAAEAQAQNAPKN
jgi:preprotein translocase subunit SecB